jgi:hypothetical protein
VQSVESASNSTGGRSSDEGVVGVGSGVDSGGVTDRVSVELVGGELGGGVGWGLSVDLLSLGTSLVEQRSEGTARIGDMVRMLSFSISVS